MWLVSARDLQFRARRFVIAVLVVSAVFGIALAIDGMKRAVQDEGPSIVASFGADQWLVAKGAEVRLILFSTAVLLAALHGDATSPFRNFFAQMVSSSTVVPISTTSPRAFQTTILLSCRG